MERVPLEGRRIWLTGATAGIGLACAREFVRRGARVAASARTESSLAALVSELGAKSVLAVPMDAGDRDANHRAVAAIEAAWGGLDTAVWNAGTCEFIEEDHFDAALVERVHRTNFLSLAYGMEAALPLLERGNSPHLVGVSSSSAWLALPRAEAYGSSKAAMRYLLDSFRLRAEARGLAVTGVYPGFVRTPMTSRNDFPMPFLVGPEEAARKIADGMEARRREIHFPRRLTWIMKAAALMPTGMYQYVMPRLVKTG